MACVDAFRWDPRIIKWMTKTPRGSSGIPGDLAELLRSGSCLLPQSSINIPREALLPSTHPLLRHLTKSGEALVERILEVKV